MLMEADIRKEIQNVSLDKISKKVQVLKIMNIMRYFNQLCHNKKIYPKKKNYWQRYYTQSTSIYEKVKMLNENIFKNIEIETIC